MINLAGDGSRSSVDLFQNKLSPGGGSLGIAESFAMGGEYGNQLGHFPCGWQGSFVIRSCIDVVGGSEYRTPHPGCRVCAGGAERLCDLFSCRWGCT